MILLVLYVIKDIISTLYLKHVNHAEQVYLIVYNVGIALHVLIANWDIIWIQQIKNVKNVIFIV